MMERDMQKFQVLNHENHPCLQITAGIDPKGDLILRVNSLTADGKELPERHMIPAENYLCYRRRSA